VTRSTRAIVVLLAMAIGVSASTTVGAQTAVSLDDYVVRLRTALEGLEGIDPAEASEQAIEAAIASLGLPVRVELPSGSAVEVTRDTLLGPATAPGGAAELRRVTEVIRTALAAAVDTAARASPDRAALDAALAEAYGGLRPQEPSITSRILDAVRQAFGWLLDRTLGAVSRSGLGPLIGWFLIFVLLAGVIMVLHRLGGATVAEARWTAGSRGEPAEDWRRLAEEALARGDLPEAVRARYHVLLETLAARGIVRDAPSLTSGECRAAVHRTSPRLAPDVDRATSAFERVIYGRLPARAEDVDALSTAEQAVRRS
jgi:uncharacterized protein DUF4129